MKNLINRALVAKKKLFIILAAVCMAVSGMAQVQLPRTYCGCTLGKTTFSEVNERNSNLPTSINGLITLSKSKEKCVYLGNFVVENHHFSILVLSFYKDTLFNMELLDEELNNNIMEMSRTFVSYYKEKYSSLEKWLPSDDRDFPSFVSCSKTDGVIGVSVTGSKIAIEMTIAHDQLANEAFHSDTEGLFF